MRLNHGMLALMLSATIASQLALTGCAGGSVVYDPYRRDYHQWNGGENRFQRRSSSDQHAYWSWRHR